jgi:hypothetical protein
VQDHRTHRCLLVSTRRRLGPVVLRYSEYPLTDWKDAPQTNPKENREDCSAGLGLAVLKDKKGIKRRGEGTCNIQQRSSRRIGVAGEDSVLISIADFFSDLDWEDSSVPGSFPTVQLSTSESVHSLESRTLRSCTNGVAKKRRPRVFTSQVGITRLPSRYSRGYQHPSCICRLDSVSLSECPTKVLNVRRATASVHHV